MWRGYTIFIFLRNQINIIVQVSRLLLPSIAFSFVGELYFDKN